MSSLGLIIDWTDCTRRHAKVRDATGNWLAEIDQSVGGDGYDAIIRSVVGQTPYGERIPFDGPAEDVALWAVALSNYSHA